MLKILKLIQRANLLLIARRSEYFDPRLDFKNIFNAPPPKKKPIFMYNISIKGCFMICDEMSTFVA